MKLGNSSRGLWLPGAVRLLAATVPAMCCFWTLGACSRTPDPSENPALQIARLDLKSIRPVPGTGLTQRQLARARAAAERGDPAAQIRFLANVQVSGLSSDQRELVARAVIYDAEHLDAAAGAGATHVLAGCRGSVTGGNYLALVALGRRPSPASRAEALTDLARCLGPDATPSIPTSRKAASDRYMPNSLEVAAFRHFLQSPVASDRATGARCAAIADCRDVLPIVQHLAQADPNPSVRTAARVAASEIRSMSDVTSRPQPD